MFGNISIIKFGSTNVRKSCTVPGMVSGFMTAPAFEKSDKATLLSSIRLSFDSPSWELRLKVPEIEFEFFRMTSSRRVGRVGKVRFEFGCNSPINFFWTNRTNKKSKRSETAEIGMMDGTWKWKIFLKSKFFFFSNLWFLAWMYLDF